MHPLPIIRLAWYISPLGNRWGGIICLYLRSYTLAYFIWMSWKWNRILWAILRFVRDTRVKDSHFTSCQLWLRLCFGHSFFFHLTYKQACSMSIMMLCHVYQLPRHVFVFTGAWAYEISRGVLISASHNLLIRQLSLITSCQASHQWLCPTIECMPHCLTWFQRQLSHLQWTYGISAFWYF